MTTLPTLGGATFDEAVSATAAPTLVEFSAPWCTRCARLATVLEKVHDNGALRVFQVDIEQEPALAARHRVMSVPALALYRNGELVTTVFGEHSEQEVRELVERHSDES